MAGVARILVIHESALLRDCITSVLSGDVAFEVIALDHFQPDWQASLSRLRPEVLVIDLAISTIHPIDVIASARQIIPTPAVVALVSSPVDAEMMAALTAPATICVPESSSLDALRGAIHRALRGENDCAALDTNSTRSQLGALVRAIDWNALATQAELSTSESEVFRLIAEGDLSNIQIAGRLALPLYSVRNHVHHILEKLAHRVS